MWANAQCDGHPAEYRWRPLFNATVWLMPTTTVPCSNATKMWNPLKFAGVPKLANGYQPLVGWSSPYYQDMCKRNCCLTSFFLRLSIYVLVAKIQPNKVVRWCRDGDFLAIFLGPVFSMSHMHYISDLHSKFALGPHYVWKYGRYPICGCWD